jgi:hypothetical protein
MTEPQALYPDLFEMGVEMAREGVTLAAAREIARDASVAGALAIRAEPGAPAARSVFAGRVKREVRALVLATNRGSRRREDRGGDDGSYPDLPVFGWIADPVAPLVAWGIDHVFSDTVFGMPTPRRETLIRVRQNGLAYAASAAEQGLSVEGVAGNVADALADLRAALRDGRRREAGADDAPDRDLVLLGRWLADELPVGELKAFEKRFIDDDAFYAKTAPVMQIWSLPMGLYERDEVEDEGLVRIDRDVSLITDYLAHELSDEDTAAVEKLLKTDTAFYVKVRGLIDCWRSPVKLRPVMEKYANGVPQEVKQKRAAAREREEKMGDDDPDLEVIGEWLRHGLPPHHERAVDDRLVGDEAFFEKVLPLMKIWAVRTELMDRLGTAIADEQVDATDPDVALIRDYLGLKLPPDGRGSVEARLRRDEAFARKAGPMVKKWRVPGRLGAGRRTSAT